MKVTRLFLALCSVALMVSCTKDDVVVNESKGSYDKGVFVLNEGSPSSISFLDSDLMNFKQDVYGVENPGDVFGKYVQSIFFNGDNAYIISGGTNTINVVNRYTFKLITKIETGLSKPRYGVVKGNKAYVTNANTYFDAKTDPNGNTDDYIAVINLDTNKYESKIDLNATANRILLYNDKLYITEPYNNSNLLVVNTLTNTLGTPVAIGGSADIMEIESGVLYTLRSPYGDRSEIVKVKLSDNSISKISFAASLDGASFMDIYNSKIYYTVNSSVYAINLTATTASESAICTYNTGTTNSGYTYGFAVENDHIHIADAIDFATNGKAYIFNLTGTLLNSQTVGIGPNGFYFNN